MLGMSGLGREGESWGNGIERGKERSRREYEGKRRKCGGSLSKMGSRLRVC
jgi:hypothetical protein